MKEIRTTNANPVENILANDNLWKDIFKQFMKILKVINVALATKHFLKKDIWKILSIYDGGSRQVKWSRRFGGYLHKEGRVTSMNLGTYLKFSLLIRLNKNKQIIIHLHLGLPNSIFNTKIMNISKEKPDSMSIFFSRKIQIACK